MEKMDRYRKGQRLPFAPDLNEIKSPSHDPMKEDNGGIDLWISLSIEGKRREIIKRQMSSHISQLKTLRFRYQV
ncbi:MAG: hypothetical protein ACMUIL_05955 [bacterium]